MPNNTWTMNCIIFGVELTMLLQQKKRDEAINKVKELTSSLTDIEAEYLVNRVELLLTRR